MRGMKRRFLRPLGVAVASLAIFLGVFGVAAAVPTSPTSLAVTANYTSLKATWTAVPSAAKYEVQFATDSKFASVKSKSTVTTTTAYASKLSSATTYYVRVRALDSAGDASSWSSVVKKKTGTVSSTAPGKPSAVNVGGTTVELSWTGISDGSYFIQATASGKATVWTFASGLTGTVTGLSKSTTWTFGIYFADPELDGWPQTITSKRSSTLALKTSSYALAAPDEVEVTQRDHDSATVTWEPPVGMSDAWSYRVQVAKDTAGKSVLKNVTVAGTETSAEITDLSEDTSYYLRILAIDANGKQQSDRSAYALAKTLPKQATIKGTVSGANTDDVVVGAYTTGNQLIQQTAVASNGSYSFTIRPGTYRVKASYLGTGKTVSLWAKSGASGVLVSSDATSVTVATSGTVTVPGITLSEGAQVSGTVKKGTAVKRAVDVTALTATTSAREVAATTRSGNDGSYTLRGLPDGTYWLRFRTSEYTTKKYTASVKIIIENKKVVYRVVSGGTADTLPSSGYFSEVNATVK